MSDRRLPSLKDTIRWYAEAGLKPVTVIDKKAQTITVYPQTDNDVTPSQTTPDGDNIRAVFGE